MAQLFFVGSLPFTTAEKALEFVDRKSSHLPFLPQLPDVNPEEDMVGQILRGLAVGGWDERASVALQEFLQSYASAPRWKFQLMGPFSAARALQEDYGKFLPHWASLFDQLVEQFRAVSSSEIWCQLDEPFWSGSSPLPAAYSVILERVSNAGMKVGLHTCGTPPPHDIPGCLHFLTLDDRTGIKTISVPNRVWGVIESGTPWQTQIKSVDQLWASASCGLLNWSEKEIAETFG